MGLQAKRFDEVALPPPGAGEGADRKTMTTQGESIGFLARLLSTSTPSGFEGPGREIMRRHLSRYCDDVRTDVHGNLIATRNPSGQPKIMLMAHIDEIGLMVSHITEEGYIRFKAVGGVDASLLPTQRIRIHAEKGAVRGIIGKEAIHLMEDESEKSKIKLRDLWIDIGARDREGAQQHIAVGDVVGFDAPPIWMENDLLACHGLDDKAGCFVVAEAMRLIATREMQASVHCILTTQEEIDFRGARTATFGVDPDIGIVVDGDHASDYPDANKADLGDIFLGRGPILYRGAGVTANISLALAASTRAGCILHQVSALPGTTGTDADAVFTTRRGIATGLVGIPMRYMHTPAEVVSLADLRAAASLLASYLSGSHWGLSEEGKNQ